MSLKNKEKLKAYNKAYYEANKDKRKSYLEANKEKIRERGKAYREANKEKYKLYHKAYREANKEHRKKIKNAYVKQRRKFDPLFRLTLNYRRSCIRAFKSIGQKKNNSSIKLLGLNDWQELEEHFSKQFYNHPETGEEMTFDNHGLYGWHLEHIIPLDSAKTEEEIIKLCHYTNLQPMWAEENNAKSNKILDTQ